MPINIHRDIDAAVAELALDIFGMFPLGNQEAGISVPQIMESHPGHSGSAEGREEASI